MRALKINTELTTSRLRLRPFQNSDIEPLFAIQSDREAMKFTFNVSEVSESEAYLVAYANQRDALGFSPWTICLKEEDTVIGWGGLMVDPFDPVYGIEVAYFFHKDYWGKGFATELLNASLTHGFGPLGLETIGAFARPENKASIRVLEKAGFRYQHYNEDFERNYYQISSDQYQQPNIEQ